MNTQENVNNVSLWNPNAAANLSLLLSPVFGAWVHDKNWSTLGNERKAKQSMYWVYGGIFVYLLGMFLGYQSIGIVYLLGWYFSSAKSQIKYVREELSDVYEKKGWMKPVGIGAVCITLFVIIASVTPINSNPELQQAFTFSSSNNSGGVKPAAPYTEDALSNIMASLNAEALQAESSKIEQGTPKSVGIFAKYISQAFDDAGYSLDETLYSYITNKPKSIYAANFIQESQILPIMGGFIIGKEYEDAILETGAITNRTAELLRKG